MLAGNIFGVLNAEVSTSLELFACSIETDYKENDHASVLSDPSVSL